MKTLGSVDTSEIVRPMCRQAIAAQPQNAGLWAARAQTHIKLEDWVSAAEDAGKAVEIDSSNAKAQLRKGCAPGLHALLLTSAASMQSCTHAHPLQAWQLQQPTATAKACCLEQRMLIVSLIRDHLRRVASFNLEEYETAKQAFDAAAALEPQNMSYQSWTAKCKAALDSELLC